LIDLSDDRFQYHDYYVFNPSAGLIGIAPVGQAVHYTYLIDVNGSRAYRQHNVAIGAWVHVQLPVDTANQGGWTINLASGATSFNWSGISGLCFRAETDNVVGRHVDFDLLSFAGFGWSIDPLLYPDWNPAHVDPISISGNSPAGGFGRSIYNYKDDEINCFEQAWEIGEAILEKYKNPFKRIEITEGAKVWLRPTQTVTVSIPTWGISNATYRVEEVIHRYSAETKLLRTTVSLVEYDVNVPSSIVQREDEGGIWKRPEVA